MKSLLVIMPVYNNVKTVARAIESVLHQDYENFHLVIIDDKSTDGSYEVVNQYSDRENVTVVQNETNGGVQFSRNVGLEMFINGDWDVFTVHDHDDYSYPNRFSLIMREFVEDDVVVVFPTHVCTHEDLTIRYSNGNPEIYYRDEGHAFYSRVVVDNLGYFYNTRHGSGDTEYMWRSMAWLNTTSYKSVDSQEPLYLRVIHQNNLTYNSEYVNLTQEMYSKYKVDIMRMIPTKNFYREKFG